MGFTVLTLKPYEIGGIFPEFEGFISLEISPVSESKIGGSYQFRGIHESSGTSISRSGRSGAVSSWIFSKSVSFSNSWQTRQATIGGRLQLNQTSLVNAFPGALAHLAIYDKELSRTEVKAHYELGLEPPLANIDDLCLHRTTSGAFLCVSATKNYSRLDANFRQ